MSKRDIIMIAITVILVGVMVGGFIYDRTPALLDRTNPFEISEDENLKVVAIEKKGITYRRVYYEAKLAIKDNYWENYYVMIGELAGTTGKLMSREEYLEYEQKALSTAQIKPVPKSDGIVWMCGVEFDDHSLVYLTSQEADGKTYLYIYYNRK